MKYHIPQRVRPRRNRKNSSIRSLVQESHVSVDDLIAPLFVIEGNSQRIPISSMPGQFRFSKDLILEEAKELFDRGISCLALFPALDESLKTPKALESLNRSGLYYETIHLLKKALPSMMIMTDVALDPYSSDGHDGLVHPETNEILNDETIEILQEMAVLQAKAGADLIGPSDMMDGRIGAIRDALDQNHFQQTSIISYTAKYASAFYGPFRDALDSIPKSGDKKSYQMDYANSRESLIEMKLDESEGADILMVKPGLAYLDIVSKMKEKSNLPIAAYNVSGEYSMVKAAANQGWIDETQIMVEMLTSFKRAGADIILSYFAKDFSIWASK